MDPNLCLAGPPASDGEDPDAAATELRALSREVHDGLAQSIAAVLADLEFIELALPQDRPLASGAVPRAKDSALDALERTRALSASLRALAERRGRAADVPAMADVPGAEEPGAEVTLTAVPDQLPARGQFLRVLWEAMINAVLHARASRIAVDIRMATGWIDAVVEDDGAGFEPASLTELASLGLTSMEERIAGVGGHLDIVSAPRSGTKVVIGMPQPGS